MRQHLALQKSDNIALSVVERKVKSSVVFEGIAGVSFPGSSEGGGVKSGDSHGQGGVAKKQEGRKGELLRIEC